MSRCRSGLMVLFLLAPSAYPSEPEVLTLREAASRIVERAPRLAAARRSAEASRAGWRRAGDEFHPSLLLTANPGYSGGLPPAGSLPSIAGVTLRQVVYDASLRSGELEAEAKSLRAAGGYESTRNETLQGAAELYARAWLDRSLRASAERRHEATELIAEHGQSLSVEGRLTDLALERSRLDEARARQRALDSASDSDLDEWELKLAAGIVETAHLELEKELPALLPLSSESDLDVARRADPELASLDRTREAYASELKVRQRWIAPVVAGAAQYSRLYKPPDYDLFYTSFKPDSWSVGVSISVPLFSGGRNQDSMAQAEASLEGVAAERRAREADLTVRVRRAQDSVVRSLARLSLEHRGEGLAVQELRLQRALQAEGRGTPDEAEKGEIALGEAQEAVARASVQLFLARVSLLGLRGELSEVLLGQGGGQAASLR